MKSRSATVTTRSSQPSSRTRVRHAPDPAAMGSDSPRCCNPSLPTRHAAESSLHQHGQNPRTPVGSPVRAPCWSSAEVFSWHQRGEGERPRRCRPSADSIRARVRSKAHRFVVAGRTGCTGSRTRVWSPGRARCVPDQTVIRGISRLLNDRSRSLLTCGRGVRRGAADDLLSSGSRVRILPGALSEAPDQGLCRSSRSVRS